MNKAFEQKVIRERIVDTKKYRYTIHECYDADKQWMEIRRLPLRSLDTTEAIEGWETVKRIEA